MIGGSSQHPQRSTERETTKLAVLGERTKTPPTKFVGRYSWLVALKPLYDMDLRKFQQVVPRRYDNVPTATKEEQTEGISFAGVDLGDSNSALTFAYELCWSGSLMHQAGLVHRDLKSANIMLQQGHPRHYRFGFAQFVKEPKKHRLCISKPGKLRGDPYYMLASDAALYNGCAEGDAYAMGKTLYEVMFGAFIDGSPPKVRIDETKVEQIQRHNDRFELLIADNLSFSKSRFYLTMKDHAAIVEAIRGLCRQGSPLSLDEASNLIGHSLRT